MLIFNRIPKCGSTTLAKTLRSIHYEKGIEPGHRIDSYPHTSTVKTIVKMKEALISNPKYIIGHLPLGVCESYMASMKKSSCSIVFVRDYYERSLSHIAYLLESGGLYNIDNLIFHLQQPHLSLNHILPNFQYKWLTGFFAGIDDFCSIAGRRWSDPMLRNVVSPLEDSLTKPIDSLLDIIINHDLTSQNICLLLPLTNLSKFIDIYESTLQTGDQKKPNKNELNAKSSNQLKNQNKTSSWAKKYISAMAAKEKPSLEKLKGLPKHYYTQAFQNALYKLCRQIFDSNDYDQLLYKSVCNASSSNNLGYCIYDWQKSILKYDK